MNGSNNIYYRFPYSFFLKQLAVQPASVNSFTRNAECHIAIEYEIKIWPKNPFDNRLSWNITILLYTYAVLKTGDLSFMATVVTVYVNVIKE